MRHLIIIAALIIGMASAAFAQSVAPTRYRVTRTQAGAVHLVIFEKATMTCNLPVAGPAPGSLRIDDPANMGRDCEKADPAFFTGMTRELSYGFTIAALHNDIDGWSNESNMLTLTLPRIPQIPSAPGNLRGTIPAVVGVASLGTINAPPYRFGDLDVAPITFDGGGEAFLGARQLRVPGYTVRAGDRVSLVLWRP